ncbi:MAG: methyltransferase [Candidatus Bathyarchaeota archaeon]|jgi:release factor glutamine methyltransferase
MSRVYKPAEDSLLLLRHARARVKGAVLDMGTGSGFIAVELAAKAGVECIVAADLDPNAIKEARRRAEEADVVNKIEFIQSDLFENLGECRFDWILFNPPYLPSEGIVDEPSWTGGVGGKETLEKFLLEASKHLHEEGAIIIILSSQTGFGMGEVAQRFNVEILEEEKLFFERLYCLILRPLSPSGGQDRIPR